MPVNVRRRHPRGIKPEGMLFLASNEARNAHFQTRSGLGPFFEALPDLLVLLVLEKINDAKTLASLCCASKAWLALAEFESLWKKRTLEEFGLVIRAEAGWSWKDAYARSLLSAVQQKKKTKKAKKRVQVPMFSDAL